MHPDFLASCQRLERQLHDGVVPCIAILCHKDELLSFDDLAKHKVREICACEMEFQILGRKYFEDFVRTVQSAPDRTPIAIGINPHSTDWNSLYSRLRSKSDQCLDGDLSGQEYTAPPEDVDQFIDFLSRAHPLDPASTRTRAFLVRSLLHPIYIFRRRVFRTSRGQGSGNYLTAFFNSFSMLMLYLRTWRSLGYSDSDFYSHVECTLLGDDSVVTASRAFPLFTKLAVRDYARTIGMFYTSADKSAVDSDFTPLSECVFLKRRFLNLGSITLAPLSLASIYESVQFDRGTATTALDVANTYLAALTEIRHHPIALGEALYNTLTRAARLQRLPCFAPLPARNAANDLYSHLTCGSGTLTSRLDGGTFEFDAD